MFNSSSYTSLAEALLTSQSISAPLEEDFSEMLKTYNVPFKPAEYYWQVGESTAIQGWIIHLSVIPMQVQALLTTIIPILISEDLPFKIIRDSALAEDLLNGRLGSEYIGKIVTIYPQSDQIAHDLSKKLIVYTRQFKGPAILTDICLGGIVHTRYGAFAPVWQKGPNNTLVKHIYNSSGVLVPDLHNIPFIQPVGVSWPFEEFICIKNPKRGILLNARYYKLSTLKADVKGDVIKALYFKRFYKISTCILKQGKKGMNADSNARDMRDRLEWQFNLSNELAGEIPIPKMYEIFEENEDLYLAMEFIKGISFYSWLYKRYRNRTLFDLSVKTRTKIIDFLCEILHIVRRLHEKGVIHRDLHPENFLIGKNNKMYIIDLELAWSTRLTSSLPFRLGTPGFISPEQAKVAKPTVKEDIYALGALMLAAFLNLSPKKFLNRSPLQIKEDLIFLFRNELLAKTITECLQEKPAERPSLATLENNLLEYRSHLQQEANQPSTTVIVSHIDQTELRSVIQGGINGLADPMLLSPESCWMSYKQSDDKIRDKNYEMTLYTGWHRGIAGPLWYLALAKQSGLDIKGCRPAIESSWGFVEEYHFNHSERIDGSLYGGSAGVAMAFTEGLKSGMLAPDEIIMDRLRLCFTKTCTQYSLSQGIAGQGIALLKSFSWLEKEFADTLLQSYVNNLLQKQEASGSWRIDKLNLEKDQSPYSLANGITGIILFLLAYIKFTSHKTVMASAKKAIDWLISKITNKKLLVTCYSSDSNNSTDRWASGSGIPGIILVLIKAYEVFKVNRYKEIATANLQMFPPRPVSTNFSLDSGLAGIGEVYLEAYKTFGESIWYERSIWIAQLFIHSTFNETATSKHWIIENESSPTADLFVGISGILHFLTRFQNPTALGHPFWPL